MYKKLAMTFVMGFTLILLVGCGSGREENSGNNKNSLKVGFVTDTGGVKDGSFNESADNGVRKAAENLGITRLNPIESLQQNQYQPNLTTMAGSADLTIGAGFMMATSMKAVADNFPDKKFLIIDAKVDSPNVISYVFKENEGAYLAGVLAGIMTKTNKIGLVGGKEGEVLERFESGFAAGVASVNKEAAKGLIPKNAKSHGTFVKYIDSFSDQSKAKEAANMLYNSGADIIFHTAAGAGEGVFIAAKEKGKYAIGVDSDQGKLLPNYSEVILCSVMKKVDEAVYTAIEAFQKGEFKGGDTITMGIKEDGVGLSETINKVVTDEAKDGVRRAEEVLRTEALIIPDSLEKLIKFDPPSLKQKS